jgi:hypothetical protein
MKASLGGRSDLVMTATFTESRLKGKGLPFAFQLKYEG